MACEGDDCPCCDYRHELSAEHEAELKRLHAKVHDTNARAQRLVYLAEGAVMTLRSLRTYGQCPKDAGDALETRLFHELQNGTGISTWDEKALLEHAIYVMNELERRGIKTFGVVFDAEGNMRARED